MPQDEFGGVAVEDTADEFGGVPLDNREEGSLYSPEEGAQLQTEAEHDAQNVPEAVHRNWWDKINQPFLNLPRLGKRTITDAVQVLDNLSAAASGDPNIAPETITPEAIQERLANEDRIPSETEQIATGAINSVNKAASSFTSPLGIATLGVGALPKIIQPIVSGAFVGQIAHETPEIARRAGEASVTGTPEQKAEAYTDLALQPAMATLITKGGIDQVRALGKPSTGKSNVEPKTETATPGAATEAGAETETQTFVGDKPVEVLEINRQKKTALVRDANDPEAAPDVVKLSDLEEREVTKGGDNNASSEQEAATVYGDLQPRTGESAGEVSAEKGSGGILTQADRGLQPAAEGQNREVPLEPLPSVESVEKTIPGERSRPAQTALKALRSALRGLARETDAAARATLEAAARKAIDRYREKRAEVKPAKPERPPDILDYIEQNYGKIRSKKGMKSGQEGYYGEGYKRAYQSGSARKFFASDKGSSPDEIVDSLRREGKLPANATVDDLWSAIEKSAESRKGAGEVLNSEQRAIKAEEQTRVEFEQAAFDPKKPGISVDELFEGDKVKIDGEEFTVKQLDFDEGELASVVLEDGRRFGVQRVDGKQVIHPDGGKVDATGRKEFDWNVGAEPAKAPEAPKLRGGERQGDLLSTQEEPFRLAGEREKPVEAPKLEPGAPDPRQGDLFARAERGVDETTAPELTEQESAHVADAARMNEHNGITSDFKLVSEKTPDGATADIAYVRGGKVFINVPVFRRWLKRIPADQRRAAVRSLLNEEGIHAEAQKIFNRQDMTKLWESLSKPEQSLVLRSYFGKNWKYLSDQLSPSQLGHEYMRRVLQWGMDMDAREVAENKGKGLEWLTQKGIDLALKAVHRIRQTLGTDTGRSVRSMLDRIEGNLKYAETAIGGDKLSAIETSADAEDAVKQVAEMSPEEFADWAKEQKGGFTTSAYEVGAHAPSQEFVDSLRSHADRLDQSWRDLMKEIQREPDMNKKMGLLNKLGPLTGQKQFFEEAWQYATGVGSGGESAIKAGKTPRFEAREEKLSAKGPVQKTIDDLNTRRKAFATIWRGRGNRDIMDQTIDAADNKANILGQQMGERLRIGTDKIRREATLAVIEANGDPQRLNQFLRQAAGNTDAEAAVRYAQRNWSALQTDALRARRVLDGQISEEQNAGIATEYRDAYVPHIYDRDLLMGAGRPFVIAGGTGTGSGFKKGRTFETIFDAIEAGYTPKTLDVADLVEHRVKTGQKIINRKEWAESLKSLTDPTDGLPLAAELQRRSRGPGKPSYEVAPTGYRPIEILPGVRIGVHEAYLPLFKALTGESWVSGSAPGKIALEVAGGIKHGLLVFDTFHASRIMQKQLFLSGKVGYEKGSSLLEYSNADLNRAVGQRLITPEIANWVRANRANANLLIDSGLNVGRIQEGLYNSVVRQVPVLGPFNKWVFEKLTRGALMEAGLLEMERVSRAKPGVPREQIARQVSRDLNAYFGNLGRQGIFKSKSAQDIARLVALAPQWVESMARTELKGAAQTVKGVTYDPAVHKTLLTGSIGKGMAQGLLAYFVGTQILNYATRGHSTFQNPEDNHKLDAWIPGPKGSHGFFLSPFSVVAELTHDMIRYASKEPSKLDAAMRIASNKASPLVRAAKVLMTGKDYDGKQIEDTWKRVKAGAVALAPTPLPLAPMLKGSSYPGQTQRQLLGSAGVKVEPAESAAQQIVTKAKSFMTARGKKPAPLELTDDPAYYKLRDLLRRDDTSAAEDMLKQLMDKHTSKQVFQAMKNHVHRPFTESRRDEAAFRQSLSDKDKVLYDQARDEQREEFRKFLELWYKR